MSNQICTNKEQSVRLITVGLKPDTASMVLIDGERIDFIDEGIKDYFRSEHWYGVDDEFRPAWDLASLIGMIPAYIGKGYHPVLIKDRNGYVFSIQRAPYDCLCGTHIYDNPFDAVIDVMEWMIKEGHINKMYLVKEGDKL